MHNQGEDGLGCSLVDNVRPTRSIDNVTVIDIRTGRTETKTVDLRPTYDRIPNGESFPHRNNGSTLRNNEGRLPNEAGDYYTEYVHPTVWIENGPGPQRIVVGQNGEMYYTPDHYDTFIPLNDSARSGLNL